jgi:hypothetical protein
MIHDILILMKMVIRGFTSQNYTKDKIDHVKFGTQSAKPVLLINKIFL